MPVTRMQRVKKHKTVNIVGLIAVSFALLVVVFFAVDSMTMYWFLLINGDDALERRQEDYQWYNDYGSYTPGEDGTEKPAETVGGNINLDGSYGYELNGVDLNSIFSHMDATEIATPETVARVIIYLMDQEGYVPNATIGMVSYMLAEGSGMGTFTYESFYCANGPSGIKYDKTMDNAAWLAWIDGPGLVRSHELYQQMGSSRYASIGLGLVQYSDVFTNATTKEADNATRLINAATEAGTYWQDPVFQISYILEDVRANKERRWDLDQNPGVDPMTDTSVTALEWCARITCGMGMPGWNWEKTAAANGKYYRDHIAQLDAARSYYEEYSGTDEWFYRKTGDGIYVPPPPADVTNTKTTGDVNYLDPFTGPGYDNATYQGVLIARMALLFATSDKVYYESPGGIDAPEMAGNDLLQYYRRAVPSTGGTIWASCDMAAATAIKLAGADPNMEDTGVRYQTPYMYEDASSIWSFMGLVKNVSLQPGDVLISQDLKDPIEGEVKCGDDFHYFVDHIQIWIGENIAGEKWPGTTANLYEASYCQYYPRVRSASMSENEIANCLVFRCTGPQWSPDAYNKFIDEYGSLFPELPRQYTIVY